MIEVAVAVSIDSSTVPVSVEPTVHEGTLHHHPKREIYVALPFVIYHDEMERCYSWFVERCQAALHRHHHG